MKCHDTVISLIYIIDIFVPTLPIAGDAYAQNITILDSVLTAAMQTANVVYAKC